MNQKIVSCKKIDPDHYFDLLFLLVFLRSWENHESPSFAPSSGWGFLIPQLAGADEFSAVNSGNQEVINLYKNRECMIRLRYCGYLVPVAGHSGLANLSPSLEIP